MKTPNPLQTALYLDLEMNCPDRTRPLAGDPEIIEFGVVELDVVNLEVLRESNYLVRPLRPISRRCSKITALVDDDFKRAKPFRDVLADISAHFPGRATAIAWGDDGALLTRACRQLHLATPFRRFIDLSQIVRQALFLKNQLSVRAALELLGLPFDGCAHVAVADARNTARIHAEIMRRLRATRAHPAPASEDSKQCQPTWFAQVLERSLKTIHPV